LENNIDIRLLSFSQLEEWILKLGYPVFRAVQIYEWLWKREIKSFHEMSNLPEQLRIELSDQFIISTLILGNSQISNDGTRKFSFVLNDDNIIESVIIPTVSRTTACISTQAGCQLDCAFCATGKLGFIRNLNVPEIIDQISFLNNESKNAFNHTLNNIVFMGMGEPLLNYNNTLSSIAILKDKKFGYGFSPQRITVSTAGIIPGIKKLGDDAVKFQLAVSLHTANQRKREQIMPVAKKYKLSDLSSAIKYFYNKTQSRITIEYLILKDFNDEENDARKLAEFCRSFPVKINIIEYNEVLSSGFQKSSTERMKKFSEYLKSKNMLVNIRQSKGCDIDAACGQLAHKINN
jgi:23S rRNA (adenine2503-C2)-methyltransferase